MVDMVALARRFAILPRLLARRLDTQLEPFNVATGSYPYLLTVFYNSGCSQQLVADKLRTDKAAVTRALRKLEADGYLLRSRNRDNRREWQLTCTEQGQRFCRSVEDIVRAELGTLLSPLSADEQRQLAAMMAKLVVFEQR